MGYFFLLVALFMYFVSFVSLANQELGIGEVQVSVIGEVIVATLFVICSVLCFLGESIGNRFREITKTQNELNEQVLDVAADIAWFKETKLTETREQQESHRSRSQR